MKLEKDNLKPKGRNTKRNSTWRPLLPNKNGIKYNYYQKVSLKDLDSALEKYISDGSEDKPNFIEYANGPYYENLILYIFDQARKDNPYVDYVKLYQSDIQSQISKHFSKYGYNPSQSNVAKALKNLETPFCYDIPNSPVYTVMSEKLDRIVPRGKHYVYWLAQFKDQYSRKGSTIKSLYKNKIAIPFSYVLNEYYMKSGTQHGWVGTGFIYRFKEANYAKSFKDDLLRHFGEQCFFNIVVYEDNVIILLAQDHANLRDISSVLGNLFSND